MIKYCYGKEFIMRVKYITCLDFTFENVEVENVISDVELNKIIENCGVICVVDTEGNKDYINSNYIMYWG